MPIIDETDTPKPTQRPKLWRLFVLVTLTLAVLLIAAEFGPLQVGAFVVVSTIAPSPLPGWGIVSLPFSTTGRGPILGRVYEITGPGQLYYVRLGSFAYVVGGFTGHRIPGDPEVF